MGELRGLDTMGRLGVKLIRGDPWGTDAMGLQSEGPGMKLPGGRTDGTQVRDRSPLRAPPRPRFETGPRLSRPPVPAALTQPQRCRCRFPVPGEGGAIPPPHSAPRRDGRGVAEQEGAGPRGTSCPPPRSHSGTTPAPLSPARRGPPARTTARPPGGGA